MVDIFRANRRMERMLMEIKERSQHLDKDEEHGEVIATITFDFENQKVVIKRKDEEPFEV